ncbi:hypothetical protein AB0M95_27080 [Sphaerisporangium sp. NPDC051017]|uniref:hypothetical protein n=1 Tax=Sphaerisporangium sp. NPDC051017 TaxID=3154636 RepID=UPI00341EBF28
MPSVAGLRRVRLPVRPRRALRGRRLRGARVRRTPGRLARVRLPPRDRRTRSLPGILPGILARERRGGTLAGVAPRRVLARLRGARVR